MVLTSLALLLQSGSLIAPRPFDIPYDADVNAQRVRLIGLAAKFSLSIGADFDADELQMRSENDGNVTKHFIQAGKPLVVIHEVKGKVIFIQCTAVEMLELGSSPDAISAPQTGYENMAPQPPQSTLFALNNFGLRNFRYNPTDRPFSVPLRNGNSKSRSDRVISYRFSERVFGKRLSHIGNAITFRCSKMTGAIYQATYVGRYLYGPQNVQITEAQAAQRLIAWSHAIGSERAGHLKKFQTMYVPIKGSLNPRKHLRAVGLQELRHAYVFELDAIKIAVDSETGEMSAYPYMRAYPY